MTANLTAVVSGAAAGGFLAATGVLQQRAAGRRPPGESLSPRLLWSLAHDRMWLAGLGTGVASYGFQALALAYGPLSLVQPIFLSELLFAVPISVRLNRMGMRRQDWAGLLLVAGGLALAILSADPRVGNPLPGLRAWGMAALLVAAVAAASVAAGRRISGPVRSSLFALGAAAVMAFQSALLDATVDLMQKGPGPLFSGWQSYSLIPVTALGVLLVMSAYQAGPLAATMPVIDAAEPAFAIAIGLAVFGERIDTSTLALIGTGAGLALFLSGIVTLDLSPVVHALHHQQDQQRPESSTECPARSRR